MFAGLAALVHCVPSTETLRRPAIAQQHRLEFQVAEACFAVSLVLMIVSLLLSLWEIWISVDARNVHLQGIQEGSGALARQSALNPSRASLWKRKAFLEMLSSLPRRGGYVR
jgi:hypothetical protein